jgi:hypothetical protein
MKKFTLELSTVTGYAERTRENIRESDITLAIAKDFSTAGESLTSRCAHNCNKPIVRVPHKTPDFDYWIGAFVIAMNRVYEKIHKPLVLNGAGNGLYTLGESQAEADAFALSFLRRAMENPAKRFEIAEVRSGGQTGYDVAIVKAALSLGIPARIHCARSMSYGYMIRDASGTDRAYDKGAYLEKVGINEAD